MAAQHRRLQTDAQFKDLIDALGGAGGNLDIFSGMNDDQLIVGQSKHSLTHGCTPQVQLNRQCMLCHFLTWHQFSGNNHLPNPLVGQSFHFVAVIFHGYTLLYQKEQGDESPVL